MPLPTSAGRGQPGEETCWTIVIVGRTSQELLSVEVLDSQPTPRGVLDYLVDAMRKPPHGEPHRPARVEVRQKSFHKAWRIRLKQVGIECVLADKLDSVDQVRDQLPPVAVEAASEGPDAAATSPEDLLLLPQEPGEVWQADVRPMPGWITGEGQPYRPWMALVVSVTDDLVLAHQIHPERPPADWLWEAVVQALRKPAIGSPHRPGVIEVGSAEQREALRPYLDQTGIECVASKQLEAPGLRVRRHGEAPGRAG